MMGSAGRRNADVLVGFLQFMPTVTSAFPDRPNAAAHLCPDLAKRRYSPLQRFCLHQTPGFFRLSLRPRLARRVAGAEPLR